MAKKSTTPNQTDSPLSTSTTKHAIRWTLKTVARHLGVSTATVSNAFNRPDQLSAEKRDYILAQCREIGYQGPNKAARSLRRGKTGIIALVMSDNLSYMLSDPVASEFTQGVAAGLESQQKHMLLYSGNSASLDEIADFVDGFICYGTPRNLAIIDELKSVTKPVVTVDFNLPNCPSINIDNLRAAQDVASLALQNNTGPVAILGLRLLAGDVLCSVGEDAMFDSECSVSIRRLQGYQHALLSSDVKVNADLIWNLPASTTDMGEQAAAHVLAQSPQPTTLLCMSDLIALGAMKYAKQQGLVIPDDLQIIGFDGIAEARRAEPSLTTIQQFSEQKGRKAAELFADIDNAPMQQFVDYQCLTGETIK